MTYRSRAGGPLATHRKNKLKPGQPRKLHHPPSSTSQPEPESSESAQGALSEPTEEVILDTLRHALDTTLSSPDFRSTIQKIKGLLYDAKWLEVFTDEALLEAYTGRWVPSRALCFRELMVYLDEVRDFVLGQAGDEEESEEESEDEDEEDEGELSVLSLGGGAGSELLALASLLSYRRSRKGKERACSWVGADIGKWTSVLNKIDTAIQSDFSLSTLNVRYIETNLLSPDSPLLSQVPSSTPSLITLLFTLTELLSQSPAATITFLKHLSSKTPSGSLFLIADSASDIASFSLGSERKWPTYTIAELVLLKMITGEAGKGAWELISGEDSRWFRLGDGVGAGWPVKLENTRYWFRLFRKL